jgi:hypothetical protein
MHALQWLILAVIKGESDRRLRPALLARLRGPCEEVGTCRVPFRVYQGSCSENRHRESRSMHVCNGRPMTTVLLAVVRPLYCAYRTGLEYRIRPRWSARPRVLFRTGPDLANDPTVQPGTHQICGLQVCLYNTALHGREPLACDTAAG